MKKHLDSNGKTQKTINSVGEFVDFVTSLSLNGKIIFRGQVCDKPLIPVVGRDKERARFFDNEEQIIETFKREAIPYVDYRVDNDWQWLTIAQHNGVPTRLLDWSLNPLVALWFAVEYSIENPENRIVWAFYYDTDDRVDTKVFRTPFSIEKTFVYFPEHVFPYIQAQSGVFTVHHRLKDTKEFIPLNNISNSDLRLRKILIPKNIVTIIRHQLNRIGINSASLFPGLKGIKDKIIYDNKLCDDELKK
jgi:FRG domain.